MVIFVGIIRARLDLDLSSSERPDERDHQDRERDAKGNNDGRNDPVLHWAVLSGTLPVMFA